MIISTEENCMALDWWKSLSKDQKEFAHRISNFSHLSFTAFSKSTFCLRNTWMHFIHLQREVERKEKKCQESTIQHTD